jgi:anti-anti-sigma regulatory factor
MSTILATLDWELEAERGPEWLIIRIHAPTRDLVSGGNLADEICHIMQQSFTRRVVLELRELPRLSQPLLNELEQLQEKIAEQGGMLRLCGLSERLQEELSEYDQLHRFCVYQNSEEAIMGQHRPCWPR